MSAYKSEIRPKKRYVILFLLVAFCVNLIFLIVLFLITIDYNQWKISDIMPSAPVIFEEMHEPDQPSTQEFPEVAALKPGASQHGMPEEFKDEDYFEALLAPQPTSAESDKQAQPEKAEEKPPINTLEQATQFVQTATEVPAHTIKQIEASFYKQKKQDHSPIESNESYKKTKGPIQKQLQFNDLARGFLNSLDEGGNDLMERKGNENIRPDFEEMRYLSYMHKIIWYMQNEWKRNQALMNAQVPPLIITGVSITINKDGILEQSAIIQSCGNNQIDEAILQGIRSASPYPPLPAHFKKDIFTAEFGIKHVSNYYRPQSNNQLRFSF